jgi:hypothetical protein
MSWSRRTIDIIFEATGVSLVAFESMETVGRNGVLVLECG